MTYARARAPTHTHTHTHTYFSFSCVFTAIKGVLTPIFSLISYVQMLRLLKQAVLCDILNDFHSALTYNNYNTLHANSFPS